LLKKLNQKDNERNMNQGRREADKYRQILSAANI
jgi:hypothetical protein